MYMIWLVIITAYDNNFTTPLMSCYFENLATLNIILATDKVQSSKGQLYIYIYIYLGLTMLSARDILKYHIYTTLVISFML